MIKNIQQQKLAQRFSPSQIQLMNMLAMPALVFEQYLANEIESNPALDADYTPETSSEDTPSDEAAGENTAGADEASGEDRDDFDLADYMYEDEAPDYVPTSSQRDDPPQSDRNTFIAAQSAQNTFVEHLLDQLRMEPLSEDQMTIGRYIIGNLDADGYLRRTPEAIADDLAFSVGVNASPQQVEQVLEVIRGFDPPGVGAHSLQDCLSLQLRQMENTPSVRLARRIVSDFFPALGKKNYAQIQERTGCSREELAGAVEEIARLNPKPGGAYSGTEEESSLDVTPDFIIRVEDDQVEVSLCEADSLPALRVSRQYTDLLDGLSKIAKPTKSQQETAAFVRSKIDAARWFIDAVYGLASGLPKRTSSASYATILRQNGPQAMVCDSALVVNSVHTTPYWVYYNGLPTIYRKVAFCVDKGLGGVMFWEVSQDTTEGASLVKAACDAARFEWKNKEE